MIVDLPGTTVATLSGTLRRIREDTGAMALSRVLTLVVVVDDQHAEEILKIATQATHQHPSRIVCVVNSTRRGVSRLDGQLRVGGDAGASEIVVLRLFGDLNAHADSVVMPLLLPDSPVVAWWPYEAPKNPAADPVGALAHRRITDAEHSSDPAKTIAARAKVYTDGDTDLVWTRTTRWRSILAAALEQPPFEPVTHVSVCGGLDSGSTDLLAAWLGRALRCPVTRGRSPAGTGLVSVRMTRDSGPIDLIRPDGLIAVLSHPGQPPRRVAMARRSDEECLADELARLDPDEVYQEALIHGLPLLKGKASMTASEATDKGLAPSLDGAREMVAELQRTAADHGSAAMVTAAPPPDRSGTAAVRQRVEVRAEEIRQEQQELAASQRKRSSKRSAASGPSSKASRTPSSGMRRKAPSRGTSSDKAE
ncbi:hypothetical protein KEM60_03268 [Austwickia sp. TVS 96-490-7B]|uniref:glucose-6-phosphate dehydrogenase assembly protein OpcA n=1 Tax=Austwickia sp. TVS 96-490-7B TaxID=2830843 RepID=UPI001C564572|nr:glucose-6-phosphate dehydrogenase assembly protein OpcA [Austwickia sp. TVS 96-490-7B]MBW3087038.1 hypothetical protein [Austwickia sp. TVS 96-490-7B]